MGRKTTAVAAAAVLASLVALFPAGPVRAQGAQPAHGIPQTIRLEQREILNELTTISERKTRTGEIARQALEVFKAHIRRDNEYILPPLTLVSAIAEGHVTPDMRWAIAMADRIKADREIIFKERTETTKLMSELREAAERSNEHDVMEFARKAVRYFQEDAELTEPTAILVGEYLRGKLPPGP